MKHIIFPSSFLLLGKHINSTVNTLSSLINKQKDIYALDVSFITDIRVGDLMVLSAQIEKSESYGNIFRKSGSLPKPRRIKAMFDSGQKVIHLNTNASSDFEKAKLLYPTIVDAVVKDLKKIGIKEYFFPFNTFMTELIGNAVEHGIRNKNINWWLHQEIDNRTRTMTFTFVDMGTGIIDSHKKAKLPFKYLFLNDKRIVLDAFKGKLGSSTKLSYRGRGLPQLREMIENGYVSDLLLITNKVSLQYKNDTFITDKISDFRGTYYCWTMNLNNFKKWKNTQLI